MLLAGEFAYKIKKPVTLPFLDFGSLAQRRAYCADELRLNRRFAPDIYLDVVAIGGTEVRVRTAPTVSIRPETEVFVQLKADSISLVPAD